MRKASLGEQELAVLRWIADHAPASMGEVAESFGRECGLARTTLLTVMERLRHKGYLQREQVEGVFRYSPSEPHEQQLRGLVRRFFEQSLGGSLDPFVTYLAEDAHLTPEQLEQLKQLVRELDAKGSGAEGEKR